LHNRKAGTLARRRAFLSSDIARNITGCVLRGRRPTHHRLKRPHRTEEHDVNTKPAIGEYWRREGHAFGDQGTAAKAAE
jgi:hypothetical protein